MTEPARGRSGRTVFAIFFLCLLAAIGATFLLANHNRNLNDLLVRFGYAPVELSRNVRDPHSYELRGNRISRPQVELPERLVTRNVPVKTQFIRSIRRDPKTLCDALWKSGFGNPGWKVGEFGSWECSSYREFAVASDAEAPSSAFLLVRGDQPQRVSSFRIKLNVENAKSQKMLTDAVVTAIGVFLDEVRWEEAPDIFGNIRELKEFDIVLFGNRIRLKKEFTETPRYNFQITPDRKGLRNPFLPDYFDRSLWLPMPEPESDPT